MCVRTYVVDRMRIRGSTSHVRRFTAHMYHFTCIARAVSSKVPRSLTKSRLDLLITLDPTNLRTVDPKDVVSAP